MECKASDNKKNCTCTYECTRRGNCCACVSYHRSRNELPGCFFPAAAERTYDRSLRAFITARSA